MASLGHLAVGLFAGRLWSGAPAWRRAGALAALGFTALSFLPDADVIAFPLGIPYEAEWGHRGASHSIAFAALVAVVVAGTARLRRVRRPVLIFALCFVACASHGLLDTLTDGGLGAALGWPWTDERMFAPWRPIPVSPIGPAFFSPRGLRVASTELVLFAPLWVWALRPSAARE